MEIESEKNSERPTFAELKSILLTQICEALIDDYERLLRTYYSTSNGDNQ